MTTLQRIRRGATSETFLYLVFTMFFIGLYYSRAMVSMFDVGIFGIGMLAISGRTDWRQRIWNPYTIPFILISCLYIISGLTSNDIGAGLHRIKMNNYYLLIPLGISCLQPLRFSFLSRLFLIFVAVSAASAIGVLAQYLFDFGDSTMNYKVGKTMETPLLHIRYSYFICLASLSSLGLFIERKSLTPMLQKVNIVAGIFLIVFLHVLAVRTGIVSFYLAVFAFLLWRGQRYLSRQQIAIIAISMVVVLVAAVKFIPSLAMKIQYSVYDLKMFFNQTGNYLYSDNLRLMSIQSGIDLLKESPLFGTGIGDLDGETALYYQTNYPEVPVELYNPPINQVFYTYAAFGLIGGTIFFLCLLAPFLSVNTRRSTLPILIFMGTFGSFIGDYSIELQLGKSAFCAISALALWHGSNQVKK